MPDQWNAFVRGPYTMIAPTSPGRLDGLSFGVKDIIDVEGQPTGCGLLRPIRIAAISSPAVEMLVAAGATCVGKTTTDQLAFGLSGLDTATPPPVNPRRPSRLVGGSSSGSAAAVAGGLVPFALSTDTAGSVRVPASYCHLVGFRPSWGAVSTQGVSALAPRFDTLGWHARDTATARAVGDVLLPPAPVPARPPIDRLLVIDEVLAGVGASTARSLLDEVALVSDQLGLPVQHVSWGRVDLQDVGRAFRLRQLADVAATPRDPAVVAAALPAVRDRFAAANTVTHDDEPRSLVDASMTYLLSQLTTGAVILIPAAAGPAPGRHEIDSASYAHHRETTIALNAIAGLLGAPSVVVPTSSDEAALAYVAGPGDDRILLDLVDTGGPAIPRRHDALVTSFYDYERALVTDDRSRLHELFAPACVRFAPEGAAYDRDAISALRDLRAPTAVKRELTHVVTESLSDDVGVTAAEFRRTDTGVTGYQTQTWHLDPSGWRIRTAHVSLSPGPT